MKKLISMALSLVMAITMFTGCNGQEGAYRLIKVNSFEGMVTIQRGEKIDAFEGLQLVSEDLVEVGVDSLLELLADSDKHIVAEENTAFKLHSAGNEISGNITIDMLHGKSLFTIDKKLNENSSFVVNTPNASLSVRGTIFHVAYDPETNTTEVEVDDGVVAVAYADGMATLEEGDAIAIKEADGKTIIEEIAGSAATDTPEYNRKNPIVYANFNFNTDIGNRKIVHASILTYKNLLDIDLPEDYSVYPTLDCNGMVYGGNITFETVNGDIIKPFARKLVEHTKANENELNQIIDEVLADYLNDPLNEISEDSYSIEVKLEPGTLKWLPEPLFFDSEFGCCKLNVETIEPVVSIYYNEKDYDDPDCIEFIDPKTGKTYYMSTASITIRGYGTSERMDPSEHTPTLEPAYTPGSDAVETKRDDFFTSDGELSYYYISEIDSEGRTIKYSNFNPDNTLRWYWTREYDSNGNEIKYCNYSEDGTLKDCTINEYDSNGTKIHVSSYTYKADGTLSSRTTVEYNTDGKETEFCRYNGSGILTQNIIYEYSSDGKKKQLYYYDDNGNLTRNEIYEYNSDGKETKYCRYDGDGTLIQSRSYEYDSDGNMINESYYS